MCYRSATEDLGNLGDINTATGLHPPWFRVSGLGFRVQGALQNNSRSREPEKPLGNTGRGGLEQILIVFPSGPEIILPSLAAKTLFQLLRPYVNVGLALATGLLSVFLEDLWGTPPPLMRVVRNYAKCAAQNYFESEPP